MLYVMKLGCFGWFVTTPVLCLSLLLLSALTRAQLVFFSSAALLLVKRGLREKEMESESWKTVNDANASVHKFCKALIIQNAASYPDHTNSPFFTLLLRMTFFTVHGLLKCWRKSYLREIIANTTS